MTHQSELHQPKELPALDRNPSLSLDLHYMARRPAERALPMDPHSRLTIAGRSISRPKSSAAGLQLQHYRTFPASASSTPSPEYRELVQLRNELAQLRFEHKQLQELMNTKTRMAEADQKKHDGEKKIMMAMIRKLKEENEGGWNRITTLKESYESLGPTPSNQITPQSRGHSRQRSEDVSKRAHTRQPSKRVSFSHPFMERPNIPVSSGPLVQLQNQPIPRPRAPSFHELPTNFNQRLAVGRAPSHLPSASSDPRRHALLTLPPPPPPEYMGFNMPLVERSRRTSFS